VKEHENKHVAAVEKHTVDGANTFVAVVEKHTVDGL